MRILCTVAVLIGHELAWIAFSSRRATVASSWRHDDCRIALRLVVVPYRGRCARCRRFNWATFNSPRRLLQCLVLVLWVLAFDLNVFFIKHALWIPPRNPLNTYRLVVWFLCSLPGVREYYEYIEGIAPGQQSTQSTAGDSMFRKLGVFAWLGIAMTCLETLISIKFGRGMYQSPWPPGVLLAWASAGAALAVTLAVWQFRIARRRHGGGEAVGGRFPPPDGRVQGGKTILAPCSPNKAMHMHAALPGK